jgi:hypothetical protein
LSSFSVLGDSQESEPTVLDEQVEIGNDAGASDPSQPSIDHSSEVFQAASEDPVRTHSVFSVPANSQGAAFSFIEFSTS